jgi:hypothetical protein
VALDSAADDAEHLALQVMSYLTINHFIQKAFYSNCWNSMT